MSRFMSFPEVISSLNSRALKMKILYFIFLHGRIITSALNSEDLIIKHF
jgi:hypothetical protein